MRPLLPGDLDCAVAVVMAQPPEARAGVAAELLAQADLADRFRKRLGRAHPVYGTGSLMSAALGWPDAPRGRVHDTSYCAALIVVLTAVQDWRGRFAGHSGR
jgi:hypothetical protein